MKKRIISTLKLNIFWYIVGSILGAIIALNFAQVKSLEKDGKVYHYIDTQFDGDVACAVFITDEEFNN